jgi:hypothetical protein
VGGACRDLDRDDLHAPGPVVGDSRFVIKRATRRGESQRVAIGGDEIAVVGDPELRREEALSLGRGSKAS